MLQEYQRNKGLLKARASFRKVLIIFPSGLGVIPVTWPMLQFQEHPSLQSRLLLVFLHSTPLSLTCLLSFLYAVLQHTSR